jgi:hypothetical protein
MQVIDAGYRCRLSMQVIDAGYRCRSLMQVSEWDCKVLISGAPDLTHLNAIERCKTGTGPRLLPTGPKKLNSREASANS